MCAIDISRVGAVTSERDLALSLFESLDATQWATESGCPRWTVQDVVAHMGATAHGLFTPWVFSMMRTSDAESLNDDDVSKRRSWSAKQVVDEYARWTSRAAKAHSAMQMPGMKSGRTRLGDLGTYPFYLMTSASTFDTCVHVRHDICSALGTSLPAADANTMAVIIEWMTAGIGQMNVQSLAWLDQPIGLQLNGSGGGAWTIVRDPAGKVSARNGVSDGTTLISGRTDEFPLWGTRRKPWQQCDVTIEGNTALAEHLLDSLRII